MPTFLDYLGYHDKSNQPIFIIFNIVIYIYLSYDQIIHQPYHSKLVNNYKFSIYFSIAIFSLYTMLMCILKINTSEIISGISPLIIILSFLIGYKFNIYYYNKAIKRVYKKLNEKHLVTNLKNATSIDELKYSPERYMKNNNNKLYQSVERIGII